MHKQIEFKNVTKIYKGSDVGLDKVDFSVQSGEFVFLIGRSGSGKSTILKMMGGYILPTDGQILIENEDITMINKRKVPFFRRKFGIFDPEMGLIPGEDVYSNIDFVLSMSSLSKKKRVSRIDALLKTMNILSKRHSYPQELSGGEYAKVMLARAISLDPKILLIDEPTANMTATDAWDFMQLLEDINQKGTTVVIASHSRELVNIMKKRTISLVAGVIVADERRGRYDERKIDIIEERKIISNRNISPDFFKKNKL